MLNSLPRKPSAAEMLKSTLSGTKPPEETWVDKVIKLGQRHEELEAKWEAQRQAEEEAAQAPHTVTGILAAEITKAGSTGAHIPLNGAGIIRAALSGLGVSSNEPDGE